MTRERLSKLRQCNKLIALTESPNANEAKVAAVKACQAIRYSKLEVIPHDLWKLLVAKVMQVEDLDSFVAPSVEGVYEFVIHEEEKRIRKDSAKPGFGGKKHMSVRTYSTEEACYNSMKDHERAGYVIDREHRSEHDECRMTRGASVVIIRLEKVERKVPEAPETKRGVDDTTPSEHPQSRETD